MDANSAGNYRCQYRSYKGWSEHSDALDLVVTGFYDKPFLSADQDHRVAPGENFSLRCSSASIPFDRFSLTKDGGVDLPQQQNGGHQGSFTLGPVNYNFSGNYRCYGWYNASPHVWSSPSNTLELVVTGMYDIPTLSVQPGPEVVSGENVTFHCHLGTATNTFFLLKEGRSSSPQRKYGKNQADFPIHSITPAHRGTYRCFGSYNDFAWSLPSAPVKLLVAGFIGDNSSAPTEPTSYDDSWDLYPSTTETELQKELTFWDHTAQNLFRIGMAVIILVAIVGLLVMDWLSRKRTQERAIRASSWEHRRRFRAQRPLNKRPRGAVATSRAES